MNKISIIVPVYNLEDKIKKCINSIIKQNYENLEVILVNDGSKDKSLEICKEYENKDKRINVIDIPNGGVEHARYVGLQESSGDYVMFVDGDDYLPYNAVEILLNKTIETNADIVIGNMTRAIGKKGLLKKKGIFPVDKEILVQPCLFENYYISFFGVNIIPVNMCAKLYKKDFLDTNLPPLTRLKHAEDLCFNMHLFPKVKRIAFTSENVYFYLYGGMTNKMNYDLFKTACKAYEIKLKYLDKYSYEKGYIFAAIELKNFFNTYIESYFKYTNLNVEEISEKIKEEALDKNFIDALMRIQRSEYKDEKLNKILNNDIANYINDKFPNKNKIKLKYLIKKSIINFIERIF